MLMREHWHSASCAPVSNPNVAHPKRRLSTVGRHLRFSPGLGSLRTHHSTARGFHEDLNPPCRLQRMIWTSPNDRQSTNVLARLYNRRPPCSRHVIGRGVEVLKFPALAHTPVPRPSAIVWNHDPRVHPGQSGARRCRQRNVEDAGRGVDKVCALAAAATAQRHRMHFPGANGIHRKIFRSGARASCPRVRCGDAGLARPGPVRTPTERQPQGPRHELRQIRHRSRHIHARRGAT